MSKDQDKRYIAIAQACLKAINTSSEDPKARESNIQRVYDAIDLAFREQLSTYETHQQNLIRVLQRIADEGTPPDQARKLAKAALKTNSKNSESTPLH
ncbi:MAG: hypothetical protein EA349_13315 [Halomonadaceae bacterium]|nr:MAG: hypothetical protein EA349_13315 [Halomonadaceae bacterium]